MSNNKQHNEKSPADAPHIDEASVQAPQENQTQANHSAFAAILQPLGLQESGLAQMAVADLYDALIQDIEAGVGEIYNDKLEAAETALKKHITVAQMAEQVNCEIAIMREHTRICSQLTPLAIRLGVLHANQDGITMGQASHLLIQAEEEDNDLPSLTHQKERTCDEFSATLEFYPESVCKTHWQLLTDFNLAVRHSLAFRLIDLGKALANHVSNTIEIGADDVLTNSD